MFRLDNATQGTLNKIFEIETNEVARFKRRLISSLERATSTGGVKSLLRSFEGRGMHRHDNSSFPRGPNSACHAMLSAIYLQICFKMQFRNSQLLTLPFQYTLVWRPCAHSKKKAELATPKSGPQIRDTLIDQDPDRRIER